MVYSNKKVGGIRFIKVGGVSISVSVTKAAKDRAIRAYVAAGSVVALAPWAAIAIRALILSA